MYKDTILMEWLTVIMLLVFLGCGLVLLNDLGTVQSNVYKIVLENNRMPAGK